MTFKNFDRSDRFNFAGLVLGVIAAIFFYFGSATMPWSIQTWDGNSPAEVAFQNERGNMASIGFILLALNFTFQAGALIHKRNEERG